MNAVGIDVGGTRPGRVGQLVGRWCRPGMRQRLLFAFVALPLLHLLTGCYLAKSAQQPMPFVFHKAASGEPRGVIVCLPGFGGSPKNIERFGLLDVVRRVAPQFDVIATDAHFAYYRDQSIVVRLHADIVAALADRYEQVWLVGNSMGGMGAASYAMAHPDGITGIFLLAPYMGTRRVVGSVSDAGGLRAWAPPAPATITDSNDRHFFQVWRWYRDQTLPQQDTPRIYLGYGDADDLAPANRLLADVLPSRQVLVKPGGHRWRIWVQLFETLLTRALEAESDSRAATERARASMNRRNAAFLRRTIVRRSTLGPGIYRVGSIP